ncbi:MULTISPECIES: tyrosine-type recombinase/integrase [Methanobacterium]|uniref:Tyr recombinase domain-containing protein n=1 Tax=Methanobacterium bryantii TaxID=2161 RepID=A0A2A2H709_METBR|nr:MULTISPECIES: site-specific integrase [Methanobacterium]OEC85812.1 hypothetical protein A9507_12260 [Methanobacterium sp. A39]PAV05033.1 hypothetical protein ASJ80_12075 [Methanobacterium bryantii]
MTGIKNKTLEIKDIYVVNSWLRGLSPNSERAYLYALADFCTLNKLNPEEMLKIAYNDITERTPPWECQITKWFDKYEEYSIKANRSPGTFKTRRTNIKNFFHSHDIPTPRSKRKRIRGENPNDRKGLSKSDIRTLLGVAKSWKVKALILFEASSGISGDDILRFTVDDFNKGLTKVYDKNTRKERTICRFTLKRGKTTKEFTTFISEETVKAIQNYLKLERVDPTPSDPLFTTRKKTKRSLRVQGLMGIYRRLNKFAGWETENGRYNKATSHMLRKFFNTQMINAGMPEEIREHLMGHAIDNKIRDAYFLSNPDELQRVYVQYMDKVAIGPTKPPINMTEFTEIKTGYELSRSENLKLKKEIKELNSNIDKKVEKSIEEHMSAYNDILDLILDPTTKKSPEFEKTFGKKLEFLKKHKNAILKS